MESGLALAA